MSGEKIMKSILAIIAAIFITLLLIDVNVKTAHNKSNNSTIQRLISNIKNLSAKETR